MGGDPGAGGGAHKMNRSDLTTSAPGMVWDTKHRKCLMRHSGVLPDPDLTEYAYALAKADRYQEAIDVLDLLDNPNTPRALNYRGHATSKLGRIDEGIGYYLKSVTLDPNYPQVREYVGEAYVIMDNYKLAREQLSTIEKLCGKDCEYYGDVAEALGGRTRSSRDLADARQDEYGARRHCGRATMSRAQYTREGVTPPVEARAF
jgi:tetratricopeptide (TPR) repeat protein